MANIEALLLDTHTFLWAIFEPQRLSKNAQRWIVNPEVALYLSVASIWEIEIKHRKGKLDAEPTVVDTKILELGIHPISITVLHIRALGTFTGTKHNDPFDRLIAAQALVDNLQLLTVDPSFAAFPQLHVRW